MGRRVRVLLTGFGPFPGAPLNPSAAMVAAVARRRRPAKDGIEIATHVFPTVYDAVARDLPALIDRLDPDAIVLVGLAARTPFLRVEASARNRASTLLPDVAKRTPVRGPIRTGGPSRLASRGPLRAIARAQRALGLDARVSMDAGRYLCNFALYMALDHVAARARPRVCLFLHVPRPARRMPARRLRRRRARLDALAGAIEAAVLIAAASTRR